MLGIGLIAVLTGIISADFIEHIREIGKEKNEQKHFCPYCGKNIDA